MGCLNHRRKETEFFVEQKWDYLHLDDFKSKGCGTGFAYGYLWFSLFLSVAVYVVDTFTAVQLLAFNRWSSQIEPAIKLSISKWIFSVCILLSFANLAYEGIRAYRVVRRGNIAECYMDSLAVRWESIRLGSGQGWKRFVVFSELTKSKKGAHYIALFTYFNFQAWIRVIFCMGPRQVVNALTLRSVYMAKLAVKSATVEGSISSFFSKLELLAQEDLRQAAILCGMLFTLVIWIFSALYLILAVCFYVFFLFHWIPKSDGGLTAYCERRVNKALLRIVTKHVNKALARGQAERVKAAMAGEKMHHHADAVIPTLPKIDFKSLQRTGTLPPAYTSRPPTPGNGEGNADWKQQPVPVYKRSGTLVSSSSNSSQDALVNAAADMGYEGPDPRAAGFHLPRPAPTRSATLGSYENFGSQSGTGAGHYQGGSGPMAGQSLTQSPTQMDVETMPSSLPKQRTKCHFPPNRSHEPPSYAFRGPRQLTRSTTHGTASPDPQPLQRTMTAPIPSHAPTSNHNQYNFRGEPQSQHAMPSRAFSTRPSPSPSMPRNSYASHEYNAQAQRNNSQSRW